MSYTKIEQLHAQITYMIVSACREFFLASIRASSLRRDFFMEEVHLERSIVSRHTCLARNVNCDGSRRHSCMPCTSGAGYRCCAAGRALVIVLDPVGCLYPYIILFLCPAVIEGMTCTGL